MLLEPIDVLSRGDGLDQARVGTSRLDVVRSEPCELGREYALHVPDELHDENLLAHVVVALYDERCEAPAGQRGARAARSHPCLLGLPELFLLFRERERGRQRWRVRHCRHRRRRIDPVGKVADGAAVSDGVPLLLHLDDEQQGAARLGVEHDRLVGGEGEDAAERLGRRREGKVGLLGHGERVEAGLEGGLALVDAYEAEPFSQVGERAQKVALRREVGVDALLHLVLGHRARRAARAARLALRLLRGRERFGGSGGGTRRRTGRRGRRVGARVLERDSTAQRVGADSRFRLGVRVGRGARGWLELLLQLVEV
mmetsp:Transcript_3770/g.12025  ORF Transcript_3770/g.12025 Transcript_3770/m.12025 type:complete len:314 (+) Transcript_3770:1146-2087(+)|eukprot:scaffold243919_cov26-Tisochrysis_lutea.AAC.2